MKLSIADWICCSILASEADPGAAPSSMALRAGRSSRKYVRRYIDESGRATAPSPIAGRQDVHPRGAAKTFLNSTLVLENASEESALPLRGRKRKLTRADWIDYFCHDRLRLPEPVLAGILTDLHDALPNWELLIRRSFLSIPRQDRYLEILRNRQHRIF